jgi:hypothetical protein
VEVKDSIFALAILAKVLSDGEELTNSGMPNALLCAEAIAMMVLGKDLPDYFPQSYLVSNERVKQALEDAERSARGEAVKRVKL